MISLIGGGNMKEVQQKMQISDFFVFNLIVSEDLLIL